MMQIEARSLSVGYRDQHVIESVSLTLRTGELVALIGPNGAGKSTLIRALAGLQPISSGAVLFDGRDHVQVTRQERARRVAYLAQKQNADWPLRAYDVVMLGRLPHRAAFVGESEADHVAVEKALRAVDMLDCRNRILDELSGGERARILLARALAVEAPLLLADEPVAALDPLHQLRVMDLLQARVKQDGDGIVIVLHDLALALRYCDRVILLDHGRVLVDGAPDLLTDDLIAEAYRVDVIRGWHSGKPFVLPWQTRET